MERDLIATQTQPAPGATETTPTAAGVGVSRLWIDTHVHLHERFDDEVFFDAAAANFAACGGGLGVLCLTEMHDANAFARLSGAGRVGRWSFAIKGEHAIEATRDDGTRIGLVAGRQVRCDDGLEVLAIGRPVDVMEGKPFVETVGVVRSSGALAVVPYGVGKWSGSRGALVKQLIEAGPEDVAFGDNGGRLGCGEQALLKLARRRGRTVLVGSDPLRIAAGVKRAGSWGVALDATGGDQLDDTWSERVVAALRAAGPTPTTFGSRVGMLAAAAQQIGVRLK